MALPLPKKIRVWNKGQITLPKKIRDEWEISDDSILNAVKIGQVLFLTPREPKIPYLTREFRRIMEEKGIKTEDLLKELKKQRKAASRELYGEHED